MAIHVAFDLKKIAAARRRKDEFDLTRAWTMTPGHRVYAVGDIHGCLNLLEALLGMIEQDMKATSAARNSIVFLGDYLDRGPNGRGVVDVLAQKRMSEVDWICLRGNHEQVFLDLLDGTHDAERWLWEFGGQATLQSYGVSGPMDSNKNRISKAIETLREVIPLDHLQFLKSLPYAVQIGDYFFCHAGVRADVPLAAQSPQDLMWTRSMKIPPGEQLQACIVHGHTPVEKVVITPAYINLDTGAYATNTLSCVVLEGTTVRQFQVREPPRLKSPSFGDLSFRRPSLKDFRGS